MAGTLFVVATPIGNLEDITLRALRTLRTVDLIAAEDTRRTAKLLAHHQIARPMVSFHEHNERREATKLIDRLRAGSSIALVSDAGTPGIADPGETLVRMAHEAGIPVTAIPGPSAVAAALSVSGLPASEFVFMGFVPRGGSERGEFMERLGREARTVVIFEVPHRIARTVADLQILYGIRQIQFHREITKIHEELAISPNKPSIERGEFVIIVGARPDQLHQLPEPALLADRLVALVGCMTINGAFTQEEAVVVSSKAFDLDQRAVRKALKKHRIAEKRRVESLS